MKLFGINNENDFYSHHYLSSVFEGDIRGVLDTWIAAEEKAKEHESQQRELGRKIELGYRAPHNQLRSYSGSFFKLLNDHNKERNVDQRLTDQRKRWKPIIEALGYQFSPTSIALETGLQLPVLAQYQSSDHSPFLWIVEAHDKFDEDNQDPLSLPILKNQFKQSVQSDEDELKKQRKLLKAKRAGDLTWQDVISKMVFTQPEPPRWLMLLGNRQCLLIDRTKWAQNRLLRFDFEEILGRKEADTLKATVALLHKDSVMPASGQPLLDNLDENSHKHAFSVSEDLKYALRESIELLGHEATQYLINKGTANYTGAKAINPDELSRECLRYMYRMLFLFYIEARPELDYAPLKSMTYLKGYSLETLRDLEMVQLTNEVDKQGRYLHDSLNILFRLIHKGYDQNKNKKDGLTQEIGATGGGLDTFKIAQLDSHLFDPKRTPTLNKVVFSNETLQRIIMLMSLSRPSKSKNKKRGRISYAQLGINQLGAVYEALLSYRGFFAHQDLYEVKKKGEKENLLETGYFVTAEQLPEYHEDEKVYTTKREAGETKKRLKMFEKGSFIYRMAGRDREKSASYYTPEVLTQSLVKYALKELFKEKIEPLKTAKAKADAIINLTVCEPAMGSAAFLNEAINQLSEFYLIYKQQAEDKRIPQDQYTKELQQVKMYIADNNVFGVDLNPVAVELAEVSLWLNAISSDAFVPWFGYQLFNGNSLIGARRQVFPAHQLEYKSLKSPSWLNQAPARVGFNDKSPNAQREEHQVYHFLLGDNGMANYTDKVVKGLKTDEIIEINKWRKEFNKPWLDDEKSQLQRISKKIDDLWQEHTDSRSEQRNKTTDQLPIWPNKADALAISNMSDKDRLLDKAMTDGASSYQRLKMVMDYWCALWFWPIDSADELPERWEYLFDIETLLDGYIQPEISDQELLDEEIAEEQIKYQADTNFELAPDNLTLLGESFDMFGEELEQETAQVEEEQAQYTNIVKIKKGELDKKLIFQHLPRLEIADKLAQQYKFFHWELEFSDIFSTNQGFDLILGNPPWLKVEWQEGGILGDTNPKFIINNLSATKVNELRAETLQKYPFLEQSYLAEYAEAQGTQSFLNADCNYPLLKGQKANLYKCFLPQSWMLSNKLGVSGFLHPEGVYDDPKGGMLRESIYPKLRSHFQFQNELNLFSEVDHTTKFSINIYGATKKEVCISHICNLFSPASINYSFKDSFPNIILQIRDENNNWETRSNKERVITITPKELNIFKGVFSMSEKSYLSAVLPVIHNGYLINALDNLSKIKGKLKEFSDDYFSTPFWNQVTAQKEGIIKEETTFLESCKTIINGPHFYIGNPFYKTPRKDYSGNSDYDCIDLNTLTNGYVPRSNYRPIVDPVTYKERSPKIGKRFSIRNDECSDYYRLAVRAMLQTKNERTLISAIIPKGYAHTNSVRSYLINPNSELKLSYLSGLIFSLPYDYLCRITGKTNLHNVLDDFPIPQSAFSTAISNRSLLLSCLNNSYLELLNMEFVSKNDCWAKEDRRLDSKFFNKEELTKNYGLKSDYSRRQALIEIDILVSMALGLKLQELISIYKVNFPVLLNNENDTWYDLSGRIVFTCSKGLTGVGLDRKFNKKSTFVTGIKNGVYIDKATGTASEEQPHTEAGIQLGWEDIKNLKSGTVTKTYMDDTMPNGPHERTIEYHAPFDKCNREDDYNTVWAEFERRFNIDDGEVS
ncbi:MAG: hypothetical protein ACI87J_001626 [Colwellia sp.]|jgi:hypothetical protein